MTLREFIRREGITASADWAGSNPNMPDRDMNHFRVTLRRRGHRYTVPFSQGYGIEDEPTAESVLECLVSDASSADAAFEDWAADYGYDPDSRTAERIYRAVQQQTAKLRRFMGERYDALLETER